MGRRGKTWEQYRLECEAIAKKGIIISGFVEPWKGCDTKLVLHCKEHGEWKTTRLADFKNGTSCPKCYYEKAGERGKHLLLTNKIALKEESFHIELFMKTGKFHPKTKFFRSGRLNTQGYSPYWNYTCPICSNDEYVKAGLCSGIFEGTGSDLKKGYLPCRCSKAYQYKKGQWEYRLKKECKERGYDFIGWKTEKFGNSQKFVYLCTLHGDQQITPNKFLCGQGCPQCKGNTQQECYVNVVYDEVIPVALKFGIANSSKVRLKRQNRLNMFQMKKIQVYTFKSVENCKAAERACLSELDCGILSSRELQDGWTETTSLQNLDKIIEIYERFGGVRIK